jgi:hypothetical protein
MDIATLKALLEIKSGSTLKHLAYTIENCTCDSRILSFSFDLNEIRIANAQISKPVYRNIPLVAIAIYS